jgi:antitoxin ParD1/3/4
MESLTITLPESLKAFVDDRVAAGESESPDAFIQGLIREAQKRRARERVDDLIQEGLDSGPATPMTADDWSELRRRVADRLAQPPEE